MVHPIFRDKRFLATYFAVWGIILIAHAALSFFAFDQPFNFAVFDASVFIIIFCIEGIGIWFPIQLISRSGITSTNKSFQHILLGIGTITIWLTGGYLIEYYLTEPGDYIQEISIAILSGRIVFGILIYGILLLTYFLLQADTKLKEKVRRENELLQLATKAELELLKAQINPHFLFNSLNSIHVLSQINPQKSSDMILELSDFLRFSLKQKESGKQSLHDELSNIKRYLNIEKIRFGDVLSFDFQISENAIESLIPNMILQPLFENAVKHGLNSGVDLLKISMEAQIESGNLNIRISNNIGTGTKISVGNNSGIDNIRKRLQLNFQQSGLIQIKKTSNEFVVELIIPQIGV
jgi:two-component system LytT family sensor kinase